MYPYNSLFILNYTGSKNCKRWTTNYHRFLWLKQEINDLSILYMPAEMPPHHSQSYFQYFHHWNNGCQKHNFFIQMTYWECKTTDFQRNHQLVNWPLFNITGVDINRMQQFPCKDPCHLWYRLPQMGRRVCWQKGLLCTRRFSRWSSSLKSNADLE